MNCTGQAEAVRLSQISLQTSSQSVGHCLNRFMSSASLGRELMQFSLPDQLGALLGAVIAYPLGYFAGRKIGLMVSALCTIVGAGIMLAANGSRGDAPIFIGRGIAGAGVGAASGLAPLYLSEISPPQIRGQVVGLYEIGWQIGGMSQVCAALLRISDRLLNRSGRFLD